MRVFLIILTITIYQSVFSQTGNYAISIYNGCFFFDEQDDLRFEAISVLSGGHNFVLSKYNGDLLMYKAAEMTYNVEGDSLSAPQANKSLESVYLNISDSVILLFHIESDLAWPKLYMSKLRRSNDVLTADLSIQQKKVFDFDVHHLAVSVDTLGNSWLLMREASDMFRAVQFDINGGIVRQEISVIPEMYVQDFEQTYRPEHSFLKNSSSGNTVVVGTKYIKAKRNELNNFGMTTLDLLEFNKTNGQISYKDRVTSLEDSVSFDGSTLKLFSSLRSEVSSNDSFLYYGFRENPNYANTGADIYSILYSYQVNSEAKNEVFKHIHGQENGWNNLGVSTCMKLFNDGNIYLPNSYLDGTRLDDSRYIADRIESINTASPVLNRFVFHSQKSRHANGGFGFGYSKYNYIRTRPQYTYDCAGHVTFRDKCDYALPNTKVNYFSEDIAGSGVLVPRGQNPTINYTQNGDYLYKVVLKSHEGTYKEIHYDTLKIRIPEKPVAAFTAADTVICAYVPLEFINESTSDTIHTTNGEKWVWTFGDGETQTVLLPFGEDQGGDTSVSHVYTTPGTYTVSLFYSNGFCDSTLTRNQYITVVDAPAPGFSIDNNRGCTPFTVTVTDTVTKNTTKKEYLVSGQLAFMDSLPFSGSWDEYYSLPFGEGRGGAFTFSQAGTYWITQRLYGYTGCITQLDSQRVFVTPGFTELDTSHITNATYQDVPSHPKVDEVITINWPCLEDAAVRYDLYRNNLKIAELDAWPCVYGQMWYADSLEQASKSIVTYTVLAIDSCGTATQVGRVGQPVYVSGEVVGNNEFSIISYTAYQDWNVGESELSYELQTEDLLGGWITINEQTSATPYNDYEFLDTDKAGIQLEKCYRVVAKAGPSKSSISTIVCLPYTPVVFIPTAFSPNGDNLNDVYRPVTFGIEHYEVDIYNRYGQKIKHFTEQDAGWTATNASTGAYMVIIRAKGTDNEWYNLKSTVTLVR